MSLFEYLAIAFGLVYSIAALRVVGGLPFATAPERRYPVQLVVMLFHILGTAAGFWTFWSFRDVEWTFPRFVLALTVPGVWYYCASVLVPENPEGVARWRDHYYAIHRRFFTGIAVWGLCAATSATVNLHMPFDHQARGVQASVIVIGTVGAVSSNPRVHAGIALLFGALFAVWALTSGVLPDWMVR